MASKKSEELAAIKPHPTVLYEHPYPERNRAGRRAIRSRDMKKRRGTREMNGVKPDGKGRMVPVFKYLMGYTPPSSNLPYVKGPKRVRGKKRRGSK